MHTRTMSSLDNKKLCCRARDSKRIVGVASELCCACASYRSRLCSGERLGSAQLNPVKRNDRSAQVWRLTRARERASAPFARTSLALPRDSVSGRPSKCALLAESDRETNDSASAPAVRRLNLLMLLLLRARAFQCARRRATNNGLGFRASFVVGALNAERSSASAVSVAQRAS